MRAVAAARAAQRGRSVKDQVRLDRGRQGPAGDCRLAPAGTCEAARTRLFDQSDQPERGIQLLSSLIDP